MIMWDPIQSRGDVVFDIVAIAWFAIGFVIIGPWMRSYYRRKGKPAPEGGIKGVRAIAVVSGSLAIAALLFHFGRVLVFKNAP